MDWIKSKRGAYYVGGGYGGYGGRSGPHFPNIPQTPEAYEVMSDYERETLISSFPRSVLMECPGYT